MLILKTPKLDVNSERWITPMEGLKLKVGSISNPAFRSHNAIVRRHIDKLDARFKVGTPDFNPAEIDVTEISDDLLIDSVAKHLLIDWEGVGEANDGGNEKAVEYSAEKGKALLLQHPELYWAVLGTASDIAAGKEEQKNETVGKS
ncbi:hypothetical protein ABEG75_11555 [Pantoea agglomerans]|uniref:hypothetical protein n=1 Tax=Enterobacter agglomerans TaxID=549 RepID=UPI0004D94B99|nr:hypothetical protein [Pantoea agglomerans]KEY43386.1 hypothetical protein FB99_18380 [Pantoea agglomerans]QAV44759.1 hypothetical protein D1629_09015 [Pantoea agglomerans]QAV49599.1 hypothetical protein D1628_10025 [Pantoea agglomerans]